MAEEIECNIKTKMDYLKSCEDYSTSEALSAIIFLRQTFWSMAPGKAKAHFSKRLADFMVEHGLAPLVVKMVRSLNTASGKGVDEALHNLHRTIYNIAVLLKTTIRNPIKQELIKSGILQAFVEDLNRCDPNTKDPRQRIRIIDNLFRLQNFDLTPGAVPQYRDAGAIPALMNFVKGDEMNTKVFSLRLLACIVNEEESQKLAASGCLWDTITMLRKAVHAPDRKYHYVVKTDDGEEREFKTTLLTITEGVVNLASNDTIKSDIVYNGGIPALTSILRPDYSDNQNFAAAEALWKISFIDSLRDMILNYLTEVDTTALSVIKGHRSSDSPKLRDVSKGLLHQLGLLEIHNDSASDEPRAPPPSYKEATDGKHVMISYNWDHQDRALAVRDKLREKGYNVWMDVDKMEGDILMAMANAVEKSEVVLMCVSRSYKASANCQTEANYAYKLKKDIIPILVECGFDADGWLGALIAMKLYARGYADDVFDKDMPTVIRELGDRGKDN